MGAQGVFPVFTNVFKINVAGRTTNPGDFVVIKDLENFALTINGTKEKWTPMDLGGWVRQAITSKDLVIAFKGKRNYGDLGNDFIASMMLLNGQSCQSAMQWVLPNGGVLTVNCVIDIKTPAGGDSAKMDTLDFEILSDGMPVYVAPGVLSGLTFTTTVGTATGTTKVSTVSPTLIAGNSYVYKVNVLLSAISFGNVLSVGAGWSSYTLAANIIASAGQNVVICEVDAGLSAIKGGTAISTPM